MPPSPHKVPPHRCNTNRYGRPLWEACGFREDPKDGRNAGRSTNFSLSPNCLNGNNCPIFFSEFILPSTLRFSWTDGNSNNNIYDLKTQKKITKPHEVIKINIIVRVLIQSGWGSDCLNPNHLSWILQKKLYSWHSPPSKTTNQPLPQS